MHEIELKFQIPAMRRAALARALATPSAVRRDLTTTYFDTPDRRLAAARLALRLRHDGQAWVQTLKVDTGDLHQRIEHEVGLPAVSRGSIPAVDPMLHTGTLAGDILRRALGHAATSLRTVCESHFVRTSREVRSGASVVAVTLDVGAIRAAGHEWPVHEVEFELVRGRVDDLLDLSERWVRRFGLWWDVRSKAERGDRLARGISVGEPQKAQPSTISVDQPPDIVVRCLLIDCLRHALPNAAEVIEDTGSAEHLHQVRVALRRLRTLLRVFGDWLPTRAREQDMALRQLFIALGAARERDVLDQAVLPALRAAGAPTLALPTLPTGTPQGALLGSPETQTLILALLRAAVAAPSGPRSESTPTPRQWLRSVRVMLRHAHRRLGRDAGLYLQMDDAARHRVRKRLKRMRYTLEFVLPLVDGKPVRRYLQRLQVAQEHLVMLGDVQMAESLFRRQADDDAQAWFGVGWCAARKDPLAVEAARALRRLTRLDPFHRRSGARRH